MESLRTTTSLGLTGWHDPERFRILVQGVKDYAIFLLDPTGRILTWNSGARRIKQYEEEEIVGRHFSIFYPPEAVATGHPDEELAIATREGRYEEDGWRLRKDGTRFWANVVITALCDEEGALRGFAKVTRDLTQRRESDEVLRRSEQRLRLLIDSIRDYAIFMLDPEGRVATWNPGAKQIKGWSAEEIVGRHFSAFYPPEDVAAGKCDRELDLAAATGRFEEEGWRVRKDGSRFWGSVVISAVRDESGRLVGFAKVTRDLTDQRDAEAERVRLAHAEEAVRVRDEFLAITAHELKTPLTTVALQAAGIKRVLDKGAPDADTYRKLSQRADTVERGVEALNALVDSLLDATRAAAGRLQFNIELVNIGEVARDVCQRFQEQFGRAGSVLTVHVDSELVARCDRRRMEQVVANFLSNALKYGAGKPVEVSVGRRGSRAVIAVRDHGIGIEHDDLGRIFDRFVRAVPTMNYGGLGLGLWISRLVIEAMGGSLSVESKVGEGATFVASLPIEGGTA